MDKITLDRIKLMHPKLVDETNALYADICKAVNGKALIRFAYTLRTYKEQDELYAIGRTKPGKKVTNAKGGQSYHNFGLAFDIVLIRDLNGDGKYETASWDTKIDIDGDGRSEWMEVVDIAKRYGWEWGGDWKFTDNPHFQKTFGKSVVELANLVAQKKLALPNTTYPAI
jgi:peptidoglycan L-alanyl-D-glutamate endopeptidase CwlK